MDCKNHPPKENATSGHPSCGDREGTPPERAATQQALNKPAKRIIDATQEVRNLEQFLARHVNDGQCSWPTRSQLGHRRHDKNAEDFRVLIVGELRLGNAMISESEFCSPFGVVGFAANAIRIASAMASQITVCSVIPAPLPHEIRAFFVRHRVDTQFVTARPATNTLGVDVTPRGWADLSWSDSKSHEFDAMLIEWEWLRSCGLSKRGESMLKRTLLDGCQCPMIGLFLPSAGQHEQASCQTGDLSSVWSLLRPCTVSIKLHSQRNASRLRFEAMVVALRSWYGFSRLVIMPQYSNACRHA